MTDPMPRPDRPSADVLLERALTQLDACRRTVEEQGAANAQLTEVVTELRYYVHVTLDRRLRARALRYMAAVIVVALALGAGAWRIADWGVRRAVTEVNARQQGDCQSRAEGREGNRVVAASVNDLAQLAQFLPKGQIRDRIELVGARMSAALSDQLAPAHCVGGNFVIDKGQPSLPPTTTGPPTLTIPAPTTTGTTTP